MLCSSGVMAPLGRAGSRPLLSAASALWRSSRAAAAVSSEVQPKLRSEASARHFGGASGGLASLGGPGSGGSRPTSDFCRGAAAAAGIAAAAVASGAAASLSLAEGPPPRQAQQALSFDQIAKIPRPGLQAVGKPTFLPDGSHVLYLRSAEYGSLSRQVYATEIATGKTFPLACSPPGTGEEENLSLEEKLRRERARQMNTGVTDFKVAGKPGSKGRILVPMSGALYIRDDIKPDTPMRKLFDPTAPPLGPGPVIDPNISKDGSLVAFVWKDEIYCVPADGSAPPRALTSGARGNGKTHGLADFLAQEELSRYEGYWISPDGRQVVYEQVDETHIPQFRIMHSGSDSVGEGAQEDHRYPFAGDQNPKVRLFVVPTTEAAAADAAAGAAPTPKEFDLTGPFGADFYLARVQWLSDGALCAQVLNREQTELAVLRLDPASGSSDVIISEKTDVWINVHDMLTPIGKDGKFIWASERTGFRHLYMYEPGSGLKQLTEGSFVVETVEAVDEKSGTVYFAGNAEGDWLGRHLYRISIAGGKPERLTPEPGTHSLVLDPECRSFVDTHNSVGKATTATLRSLSDSKEISSIFRNEDPLISELNLDPPEFAKFPSADGKATLQAALYKPDPAKFGPGPYPTVVSCYGGPHVQFVGDQWGMTVDLRAQALRSRGCLVLKVDNRGSSRRGLEFEGAIKHDMGNLEVEDQAAGVRWAASQGLTDAGRVGIYGWSYGGYLAAMCLVKAPDVFKCAVSGAPVTHWDGYDTCYTERYMGTPKSNPEGYRRSAVMEHVGNMKGDLMLIHGLIDENVHFRHSARLINALIVAGKPYQLILFPSERHSPRSQKDRAYCEERMWAFFEKSLGL